MSTFELAIPTILRHEGGFNNIAGDPGGATNYGVSLRWLKSQGLAGDLDHDGDVDIADIRLLTPSLASGFYRTRWWDAYHYDRFVAQAVATKIFDMAVNMGPVRAHKMLQQAVQLPQDGILGPKSFGEANAAPVLKLIIRVQDIQAQFYRDIAKSHPDRVKFLNGWIARAYDRI